VPDATVVRGVILSGVTDAVLPAGTYDTAIAFDCTCGAHDSSSGFPAAAVTAIVLG
jgi:hypothetical protein